MRWLHGLLRRGAGRTLSPQSTQPENIETKPTTAQTALPRTAADSNGQQSAKDFDLSKLLIIKVLSEVTARWPTSDEEDNNWCRAADRSAEDGTSLIAAALALHIQFTTGFWRYTIFSALKNIDRVPLSYLEQQAKLFHVDRGSADNARKWAKDEAEVMCDLLPALKRSLDKGTNKRLGAEDCRRFLSLAQLLPEQDPCVYDILAFIAEKTILSPDYKITVSDVSFWQSFAKVFERGTRTPDQIATAAIVKAIAALYEADQDQALHGQAIQFGEIAIKRLESVSRQALRAHLRGVLESAVAKRKHAKLLLPALFQTADPFWDTNKVLLVDEDRAYSPPPESKER